jgi:hypothetical protein
MFEPENDIERLLMRAATEPAERPGFAQALMDAQVFVALIVGGAPIVKGADGSATIPEGATLSLPSVTRGDEKLLPFFSAPVRAHALVKDDHVIAPDTARNLFVRYPNVSFVLNPGSDYGKEFTPAEVKRLLAGQFDDGPQTIVVEEPEQILLAHPSQIPDALIAALGKEFDAVPSVKGAWLMLAMRAHQAEQSWMLGVDHDGAWPDVQQAIGRAVAGDVLGGRMLDAMPLNDSEVSSTLRTGIPIVARKRGFLKNPFK